MNVPEAVAIGVPRDTPGYGAGISCVDRRCDRNLEGRRRGCQAVAGVPVPAHTAWLTIEHDVQRNEFLAVPASFTSSPNSLVAVASKPKLGGLQLTTPKGSAL